MPLKDFILNQLKCSLHQDGHIAIKPVVLKCGGNCCKKCVTELKDSTIHCYSCNQKHAKKDLTNAPMNNLAEALIECSLKDLFNYIENKFEAISKELEGILICMSFFI